MDIPEHLIERKVEFLKAEDALSALVATMPRAIDIATGAATLTDEQRAAWDELHREQQQLAADIQADPWWATANQAEARVKVAAAAKERLAAK